MITIDIPGGTATLQDDAAELTPRRRRPVELLQTRIGRKLNLIQRASRLIVDGEVVEERDQSTTVKGEAVFNGGDVELTERDIELLSLLNDALAWSLLDSWTLDRPLPATPDEFLDIPQGVYNAIRQEAAVIFATDAAVKVEKEFSPAGMEEPGSPTGSIDA